MRNIHARLFWVLILTTIFFNTKIAAAQTIDSLPDGVIVHVNTGAVKIQVCGEQIVRVLFDPKAQFQPAPSLMITREWPLMKFEVQQDKKTVKISTAKLTTCVNLQSCAVSFWAIDGKLLFQEDPDCPKIFTAANVLGEQTFHGQMNFQLLLDEAVYGLRQHQNGVMNYRGQRLVLTQENTEVAVPFLISTNNYGILLDNYSKIIFDDRADSSYFWCEVADQFDYYFIAGSNMDNVISGYREATGAAPMFSKWVFGY